MISSVVPLVVQVYNNRNPGAQEGPMATAEPRFTRDQPEVRRRKLIEATAQCLAELGYAGTSVRAVAAKADVSPGLVAHHFSGIDELIIATYDHVGRRVAETLTAAMDAAPEDAES